MWQVYFKCIPILQAENKFISCIKMRILSEVHIKIWKKITMFGTWTGLSSALMVAKIRRKFLAFLLYWHSKEKGISGPFLKYLSTSQWTCRDSFSSLASSARLPQRRTSIWVSVQRCTKKCCAIKSKINFTFKKSLK